jgi:hypothetical protein
VARLTQTGDRVLGYGVKPMAAEVLLHAIDQRLDTLSHW